MSKFKRHNPGCNCCSSQCCITPSFEGFYVGTPGPNGCLVQATDTSTTCNGAEIVAWRWNINNGQQILTTKVVNYFIPYNQRFDVSLEVTDENGCKATKSANVGCGSGCCLGDVIPGQVFPPDQIQVDTPAIFTTTFDPRLDEFQNYTECQEQGGSYLLNKLYFGNYGLNSVGWVYEGPVVETTGTFYCPRCLPGTRVRQLDCNTIPSCGCDKIRAGICEYRADGFPGLPRFVINTVLGSWTATWDTQQYCSNYSISATNDRYGTATLRFPV